MLGLPGLSGPGVPVGITGVPGGLLGPAAGSTGSTPVQLHQLSARVGLGALALWKARFCGRAVPSASTAFSWLGLTLPSAKCHWFGTLGMLGMSPDSSDRDTFTCQPQGSGAQAALSSAPDPSSCPCPPSPPVPRTSVCCWVSDTPVAGPACADTSRAAIVRWSQDLVRGSPRSPAALRVVVFSPTVPTWKPQGQDQCTGCLEPASPTP